MSFGRSATSDRLRAPVAKGVSAFGCGYGIVNAELEASHKLKQRVSTQAVGMSREPQGGLVEKRFRV